MKKILFVLAIGCALMSCRSKIDFGNIDTKTEIDMGLALPIGSVHITLKEMIGEVDGLYIDSLKNKGVLTWKMDTAIERYYHQMNLAQYLSTKKDTFNVLGSFNDFLSDKGLPTSTSYTNFTLPIDVTIPIEKDFYLPLVGINADKTIKERLDKAAIDSASFFTLLTPYGLPFDMNWLDSIVLDLGPRFKFTDPSKHRPVIYARPTSGSSPYGINDTIPINVYDFTLDMMKLSNEELEQLYGKYAYMQYVNNNVYDTCAFKIKLQFTIPKGTMITSLNSKSGVIYHLGARFLDYSAIYGMFEPSKDMYDESIIDMGKSWGKLDFLTKAKMPFSEPVIDAQIVTKVAGALMLQDTYLFALDMKGDTAFAEFSDYGDPKKWRWYNYQFQPTEYLPLTSLPGDSSENMYVQFNNTLKGGQIHKLFRSTPQKLGYRFSIEFNRIETPQIRITPSTMIRVNTHATLPFIFDDGVWLQYPDTTYDVNLSQLNLDSLQNESNVIDTINTSTLKLILIAKNSIPLRVKLAIDCYDASDNLVMDPVNPAEKFQLFDQDTILLDPPTFAKNSFSQVVPVKDGTTTMIATLSKQDMDVLPKINKIVYNAMLDDDALDYAYEQGLTNVRLTEDEGVTLKIGITANVNAVLNFEKNNQ